MLSTEEEKEVSEQAHKENSVRRMWITLVICICVVADIASTGCMLLGDPYDDMESALHYGMPGKDILNALGQPCHRVEDGSGWAYLFYRKSGTNTLLAISMRGWYLPDDTINDWAILTPHSGSQPANPKSEADCSLGKDCIIKQGFGVKGVNITGISCTDVNYEVVKGKNLDH
jgi:hypothetical protein